MYWCIRDLWGPTNLVPSTVGELDDTLPHFTDVQWDSVWATHGLPIEVFMWKMALGRGSPRSWLFDSHRERWPLMVHSWLACVMLLGYFPCTGTIDSNVHNTLGYGWSLLAASKRRDGNNIIGVLSLLGWCWLLCSDGMLLFQSLLVLSLLGCFLLLFMKFWLFVLSL
jgi:hypothetical protein